MTWTISSVNGNYNGDYTSILVIHSGKLWLIVLTVVDIKTSNHYSNNQSLR